MTPKIVVGMMGSSVARGSSALSTPEQVVEFLNVVKAHGVKELDTARVYNAGKSEELLGAAHAQKDFVISTKAPGFSEHSLREANILRNSDLSHAALMQDKVDIYYIHGPDKSTPLAEQCRAFGQLYKQGRYSRFGVSNLSATQVQEIHDICVREGYPLPSVYQGAYNPLYRAPEEWLFPLLRKLNMVFYAFSPLAGGLLAKPIDDILKPEEGTRFREMPIFGDIYLKDANINALQKMNSICEREGVSMMEATMRWFMHHTPLTSEDALIIGASRKEQIDATLTACEKGPLPKAMVDGWNEVWETMVESGSAIGAMA